MTSESAILVCDGLSAPLERGIVFRKEYDEDKDEDVQSAITEDRSWLAAAASWLPGKRVWSGNIWHSQSKLQLLLLLQAEGKVKI